MKKNPFWYYSVRGAFAVLGRVLGRMGIAGRGNVPKDGACILVSNHLSHLDPPLIAAASPRYVFFMAKDELFRAPLVGPFLRAIGTFPVKRGTADRAALRRALQTLEAGEVLGMFPEGHRSEDAHLQVGEEGVGLIALRSRAPIAPIGITGTQTVLPPHSVRLRFGRIAIRVGRPFTLDDLYGSTDRNTVVEATRRVMAAIAALLPPEYQPAAPSEPVMPPESAEASR